MDPAMKLEARHAKVKQAHQAVILKVEALLKTQEVKVAAEAAHQEALDDLGEALAAANSYGLTYQDLADLVNVSTSTIGNYIKRHGGNNG